MDDRIFTHFIKALGKAIRAHRAALGYSQESFANQVGVHRTYLGAIERGERNPSLRNLCRIAQALSMSLSDLFRDTEQIVDPTTIQQSHRQ